MSWLTSTCPSQSGPAPMPMVGTDSAAVTCRAASAPTASMHHRERAGPFERVRVLDQGFDVFALHGLPAIAAHLVHRLGLEPEVAHHRNAHLHHAPDGARRSAGPPSTFTAAAPACSRRPALRTASSTLT